MTEIEAAVAHCALFRGIGATDATAMLAAMGATTRRFAKGEMPVLAGFAVHEMGIVAGGTLEALQQNAAGDIQHITRLRCGDVFGDMLAAGEHIKSPVTVQALEPACVLFIRHQRIFALPESLHAQQSRFLHNMMNSMAEKYFAQQQRVSILAEKSLQARVLRYLRLAARRQESARVAVPPRAALAAYLGCDRAALSRVLHEMERSGTLALEKGVITVLNVQGL